MVNNILEGLIWFWVPASLVVVNDITAYIWGKSETLCFIILEPTVLFLLGMLFGRTPLTELSPKKTVEGFVGAFFSTLVFAYVVS